MERRVFGPTGARVPVIGQGTWHLDEGDRREAIEALRAGLDAGLTHVDTAEMYGDGAAEEIVGEAIVGRRHEVYLVSKVLPSNATRDGTVRSCEASLRRLRTDVLDCYVLHWPGSNPLEETIAAFEGLVERGKIRAWGLSNFDEEGLEEALRVAGPGKIACDQVLYHLQERAIEHAVAPWCAAHGVALVAYSPFGSGDFPAPSSGGGRALAAVARAHRATPRQVALAFLTRERASFAIPRSSSAAHATENAGEVRLTEDDLRRIDAAFPRGAPRPLPIL
jgi:diketogulonate reductase-like aldo/keto reductase